MELLGAFERDVIHERTMAGLAAACAGGDVGGRPTLMTPAKVAIARQILDDGLSQALIAQTIGVSRPTLYAHLGEAGRGQIPMTDELRGAQ